MVESIKTMRDMMKYLTHDQLEELKQFDTPTVANALERFNLRPRTEGFTSPKIRAIFSDTKRICGYAVTAKVSARTPKTAEHEAIAWQYYEAIRACPKPISVIQDIDEEPIGSFWGEVQASIHVALGCDGVITNGGVRDLDEVHALDFSYLASCVLVSHAYIHMEAQNTPVEIGRLVIRPGDLLHADKHGAIVIPAEVAHLTADACRAAIAAERPVIDGCASVERGSLSIEQLRIWRAEMDALRAK
jgi:4-hydroxy-4-methyl-2-oxoglutarate aldolase